MSCVKPTAIQDGENHAVVDTGVDLKTDTEEDDENVDNDRLKTDNLLNIYNLQSCSIFDQATCINLEDWSEAVSGWRSIESYPKYVTTRKKRRTVDCEASGVIRCVNDDDRDHHLKLWRASVEPITYRYIPNNAQYRNDKFSQVGRDWYTIRKIQPEKIAAKEPEQVKQTRQSRSIKRNPGKKSEIRSRSTNSDGALVRPSVKCTLNVDSGDGRPKLLKSSTDLFTEGLDSKLDQLEFQIKENMKCTKRRSYDSQSSSEKVHRKKGNSVKFSTDHYDANVISRNLRPLEKVTPKQRIKISLGIGKNESAQMVHVSTDDTCTSKNGHSSIAFEGIGSENVSSIDNGEKIDSYLLGKGKHIIMSTKPIHSDKKKSAILSYTKASASESKSQNKSLVNSSNITGSNLESNDIGGLPEVSGKRIPVIFTTAAYLKP